jgi:hypothetical protein
MEELLRRLRIESLIILDNFYLSNLILFWSRNQSIKILCKMIKKLAKKSIDQTLVHSLPQSSQFTQKIDCIRIKTVWKIKKSSKKSVGILILQMLDFP